MADCGTYSGYQAHRNADEDACEPCKAAARAYQADYRKRNPQTGVRQMATQAARMRALRRLAIRHPAEFRRLYEQERAKDHG